MRHIFRRNWWIVLLLCFGDTVVSFLQAIAGTQSQPTSALNNPFTADVGTAAPRYAVIDITGGDYSVKKLTNSGYVLQGVGDPSTWHDGSFLIYQGGLSDITENGGAVGSTTSGVNKAKGYPGPPYEYQYMTTSMTYMAGPGVSPTLTTLPNNDKYNGVAEVSLDPVIAFYTYQNICYGWGLDEKNDRWTWQNSVPNPPAPGSNLSISTTPVLYDTFENGRQLGTLRYSSTQTVTGQQVLFGGANKDGDALYAKLPEGTTAALYNPASSPTPNVGGWGWRFTSFPSGMTYSLNGTLLPFVPVGLSNRMVINGQSGTVYVVGENSWWDGDQHTVQGAVFTAVNAHTAQIPDPNNPGSMITKPAIQIIGYSGSGASLWEMDPATGKLGNAQNLVDLIPKTEGSLSITPLAINDSGEIAATTMLTTIVNGAPSYSLHTVLLCPMQITFKKVADNWDIGDNKDPAGNWMPGHGKRMFVDAKTPTETTMRDTVYVNVQTGAPQGWKVLLKAFDVDDPTLDSLDPNHIIDSNDTATMKKGNDNRGLNSSGTYQAPQFVSSADITVTCTVDAEGAARLADGTLPTMKMTDNPGDNVRVAAVFLKPDGTAMSGQDLGNLQVTDSTQPGYVPPSDDGPGDGFNGAISPMLTVWRKLNIEIDSMPAVPTSGSQKNFEQSTVTEVANVTSDIPGNLYAQQSIVVLNDYLQDTLDRYENGYLTVGGVSYKILSSDHYDYTISGNEVVVSGSVPNSVIGQSDTVVDDDDEFLSNLGLPASLPQNQNHAAIINGIRPAYAQAYIQVEDANALGWNPNQSIPFYLNADGQAGVAGIGNVFDSVKDLSDTNTFWAFTISFGYQPVASLDYDPDTESIMSGVGLKYALSGQSFGFAAVYMESIRERADTIGTLENATPTALALTLGSAAQKQGLINKYYNVFYGVVAHEIGHSPGGQSAIQDHAEGGIMEDDAGSITLGFKDVTIKRFRNAQNWTFH